MAQDLLHACDVNMWIANAALGAGSSRTDPKVVTGKKYIVPDRFQI